MHRFRNHNKFAALYGQALLNPVPEEPLELHGVPAGLTARVLLMIKRIKQAWEVWRE